MLGKCLGENINRSSDALRAQAVVVDKCRVIILSVDNNYTVISECRCRQILDAEIWWIKMKSRKIKMNIIDIPHFISHHLDQNYSLAIFIRPVDLSGSIRNCSANINTSNFRFEKPKLSSCRHLKTFWYYKCVVDARILYYGWRCLGGNNLPTSVVRGHKSSSKSGK